MSPSILRVALPAPLPRYFDYLPPKKADGVVLEPGLRVQVPFGNGSRIGIIVGCLDETEVPAERMKPATAILDREPMLDPAHLDFLEWAAAYYHYPAGEVICAALPLRLRKRLEPLALRPNVYRLLAAPEAALAATVRAPRQRELVRRLLEAPGQRLGRHELAGPRGKTSGALRALLEKDLVGVDDAVEEPAVAGVAGPSLSKEQEHAVSMVTQALGGFAAFLLLGVTGSGKTEVYLRLAGEVLARGDSVMLLVPEISLTPQLQQRFAERLGAEVALLHSGLSEGEREQTWQRVRRGLEPVVLGTRSSVLYPVHRLGLVVVDEEHDTSFKQQEGFRYSARDLAVIRAQRAGCPVVLGSATPSLESLRNVELNRYGLLRLSERAGGAQPPRIDLLDIRDQPLNSGLSAPLISELGRVLERGEQAMVFINRRGYAPVLACYDCGWVSDCPRCDARQTVHRGAGLLWCHHCGSQRRIPTHCPGCGSAELHPLGQGTEQLEQRLAEQFPGVPLIRVDRDATARKGALQDLLERVHASAAALLVGTQMLAKGHHFPNVTLVGVVDADGGLFSADFRAPERMAQLLMQVAGRAGRGDKPGRVLIQTRYPEHPLLQTLCRDGYEAFATVALAERRDAGFPPFTYQALLRVEAGQGELPMAFLEHLSDALGEVAPVELWGPVPAPMARRVGRYRAHLLIQAETRNRLHTLLDRVEQLLPTLPEVRRVRWSLDVDPVDTY
jgi:primosomal protein N' (replication factor Y)